MKAFKVDGLVVSCTDAPKGDKDLIREKAVNMAYFSKKKEGYSHTCSEMEAVALVAKRDGLPEEASWTVVVMGDKLPREIENPLYRYLIAISKLRLGILTEQGEGS